MKKSFSAWYLFLIFFLFACAAIEVKEDEYLKKGKFSLASNFEYFSGTINVSNKEKRIKINLDGLSKDFKISLIDEKIKANFQYENIIRKSDLKLFLKWFFFKCTNIECENFSLQNLKLKKHLSDKTGLIIQGNFEKYRFSLKLNDI
tara:strand:- start:724 stop:1164 length:441 start_codon:yes stop_codon:yes gene_type:complete